jgi:ATP-dependent DNA ligase
MLSTAADALPDGDGWLFEPKWDGFRTLVFRDGDEIVLQSRDEKPMNRYFPELDEPLKAQLPERCVVDGEVSSSATTDWSSRRCCCAFIPRRRA